MKFSSLETGWFRVDLRPDVQLAFEFEDLDEARNMMDMIDAGIVPREALLAIARRRKRKARREAAKDTVIASPDS